MTYRISGNGETIGEVSLDSKGALVLRPADPADDRLRYLIDGLRDTRIGSVMSDRQLFRSLPQRLNNGYISCVAVKPSLGL